MQTLIRSVIFTLILFTFLSATTAYSQPPEKARERVKQMKKMKLLDILNLSEEEGDKFIVKYSSWENKVEDQRVAVDKVSDELLNAIKDDASNEDLQKMSQKLLAEQEKFFALQIDKLKAMKEILDDKKYAKYLVFEDRFIKELTQMMMKRGQGGGQGRGKFRDEDN